MVSLVTLEGREGAEVEGWGRGIDSQGRGQVVEVRAGRGRGPGRGRGRGLVGTRAELNPCEALRHYHYSLSSEKNCLEREFANDIVGERELWCTDGNQSTASRMTARQLLFTKAGT